MTDATQSSTTTDPSAHTSKAPCSAHSSKKQRRRNECHRRDAARSRGRRAPGGSVLRGAVARPSRHGLPGCACNVRNPVAHAGASRPVRSPGCRWPLQRRPVRQPGDLTFVPEPMACAGSGYGYPIGVFASQPGCPRTLASRGTTDMRRGPRDWRPPQSSDQLRHDMAPTLRSCGLRPYRTGVRVARREFHARPPFCVFRGRQ